MFDCLIVNNVRLWNQLINDSELCGILQILKQQTNSTHKMIQYNKIYGYPQKSVNLG